MSLSGFYTVVKYLMFAFNFIFWILGCAILGVGIWVRSDPELAKYVDESDAFGEVYVGSYILMGVGAFVMIIGFLGCCGSMRESQCLLMVFFMFLFLIFVTLLCLGLYLTLTQEKTKEHAEKYFKTKVDQSLKGDKGATKLMSGLQTKVGCCGATEKASKDYGTQVPDSCVGHRKTSCTTALFDLVRRYIIIIAGVSIGIGVIMLLGMVFSCILCCGIRLEERNLDYRYKY